MAKLKYRIPVVKCRTSGCETDLDYTGAGATGIGALPPFQPDQPYKVFVKSVMPNPGKRTCPECKQAHEYTSGDITEKQILEPEVGDIVLAHGQNGRFELTAIHNGMATLRLVAEGVDGPVNLNYTIQVSCSVLIVFKAKV